METVKTIYLGDLRTQSEHLRSGEKIITDAPIDNQGKGMFFSPTDLLATSLATCIVTIMGITARTHKINIDGLTARTTKIMAANPRKVAELIIELDFPDVNYTNKEKTILENSAKTCPVLLSLNTDIIKNIKFNYK